MEAATNTDTVVEWSEGPQPMEQAPAYTSSLVRASWLGQQLGTELVDPRTNGWMFVETPWPTLALILTYLIMCTLGPKVMESRKPFDLRNVIVLYNAALVLLSGYMFLETLVITMLNPGFESLWCSPVDFSDNPLAHRLLNVMWLYYASKALEFFETLLFVLRKKNSQISFLHVYHHSSMFFLWWLVVRHVAGGSTYFSMLINSLVHTVMYIYYMISAMGEKWKAYIWWKKYLTRFQLVQFWLVSIHISYTIWPGCGFPRGYASLLLLFMFTQKALFLNFYMKAYKKTAAAAKLETNASLKSE